MLAAGAGTLPESWGDEGSFPTLRVLTFQSGTKMSGTLAPSWGSPAAWQQLQYLYATDCSITGEYMIQPLSLVYQKAILMVRFTLQGPSKVKGFISCHSAVALHMAPSQ